MSAADVADLAKRHGTCASLDKRQGVLRIYGDGGAVEGAATEVRDRVKSVRVKLAEKRRSRVIRSRRPNVFRDASLVTNADYS